MKRPNYKQPADLWECDGSLRNGYVSGASANELAALLELARRYPHNYSEDGEILELPISEALFQNPEHSRLLQIQVGSVAVSCHFFVPDEIELDIDPRQVASEGDHRDVLAFLERLAVGYGRQVRITA